MHQKRKSTYKSLRTACMEVADYSRMRDTSALPRDPLVLGHKPNDRERYDAVVKRLTNKSNITPKDLKLASILKKLADDDEQLNTVDDLRVSHELNNKDTTNQRHLVRNKKQQQMTKIHEEEINEYQIGDYRFVSSADKAQKMIAKQVIDKDGRLITKSVKVSYPKRRITYNKKTEEENS